MPYFTVITHGRGKICLWNETDTNFCRGFYTTSIFKTDNEKSARILAVNKILNRWEGSEYRKFLKGGLKFDVDEVIEISANRFYKAKLVNFFRLGGFLPTIPEKGHTFYSEE